MTTGASSPSSITIKHGKEKAEGGAVASTKGEGGGTAATPAAEGGFGNLKGRRDLSGDGPKLGNPDGAGRDERADLCKGRDS